MPRAAALGFLASLVFISSAAADVETAIRGFFDTYVAAPARCRRLDSLRIGAVTVDGDTAAAEIEASVTSWSDLTPPHERQELERRTLRLRRTDGEWRVESAKRAEDDFLSRFAAMGHAAQIEALRTAARTPALADRLAQHAIALVNGGDFTAAARIAAAAKEIAEESGDPLAMASALEAQSVLARVGAQPDFVASATLAGEAVRFAEASGDADAIARALLRRGRASSSHTEETRAVFERIMALAGKITDVSVLARAATQLAQHHNLRGDHRTEMGYALLAARYADQSGDRTAILSALMNVGGAYQAQNDWELAAAAWERAVPLAREFPAAEASVLGFLAQCRSQMGEDDDAVALWERALALATGPGCHLGTAAEILVARAGHFSERRKLDDAARDAVQAFEYVKSGAHLAAVRMEDAFSVLAGIALLKGEAERAFQMARGADDAIVAGLALQQLGRSDEARRWLEAAVANVEISRRAVFGTGREHALFLDTLASRYVTLIDVLVARGDVDEALIVAERFKGRVLREALASPRGPAADDDAEKTIGRLNRAIIAARDPKRIAALRRELAAARAQLLDSANRSTVAHPAHRLLDPEERAGQPIALTGTLASAVVLDYVVTPERTVVLILKNDRHGRTKLSARVLPIRRTELRQQVNELRLALEQRDLRYYEIAASLYARLLTPLDDVIAGAPLVCVIPAEELWRVPFHALLDARGRYLVGKSAVIYAPSVSLLQVAAGRVQRRTPTLLAFANPNIGAGTAAKLRSVHPRAVLGPIPEAESEVRQVVRLYGSHASKVYIGDAARESVFKREAGGADVLHIASHGLLDDASPMFSALVLSTTPGKDSDDGLLEAREIAELHLRTRIAVLSACDTAGGSIASSEGVIGLSWALFAAGCPTAVVSQWKAVSETTATLMIRFHRHLLERDHAARALQRAQLALMRDRRFAHPYYWAPFVVVGSP